MSSRKSDPQHKQTAVHVSRRRLFPPDCFMQSPRDSRLSTDRHSPLSSRKGDLRTCGFLTRLLSIKIGLRLGSKIRDSGSMLTGLWRLPSLHSFQSGFRTPQKSTPVQLERYSTVRKVCHFMEHKCGQVSMTHSPRGVQVLVTRDKSEVTCLES